MQDRLLQLGFGSRVRVTMERERAVLSEGLAWAPEWRGDNGFTVMQPLEEAEVT